MWYNSKPSKELTCEERLLLVKKEIKRFASWTKHQSDRDVNPLKFVALIQNSL